MNKTLTLLLSFPIGAMLFSCSSDDFFSGKSDIPETVNTETDWDRTVKVIEYNDDEETVYRTTETFYDEYGRKTGQKTVYGNGSTASEETGYIYKGNMAQYYYVFYNSYNIEMNGTDRFRHVVSYRDNWKDLDSETVWNRKKEAARSEWVYDTQGRVTEFRYYHEGKLYSGRNDYRYNGENVTYYDVFYDKSGAVSSRYKVEVETERNDNGSVRREYHYKTDGTTVSYHNEWEYDTEGRLTGMRSYAGNELRTEEMDFEYDGKTAVYYRYNYYVHSGETIGIPDTPGTRADLAEERYKTKIKKIFY